MKQVTFSITAMVTMEIPDDRDEDEAAEQVRDKIDLEPPGLHKFGIHIVDADVLDVEVESSTGWDDD